MIKGSVESNNATNINLDEEAKDPLCTQAKLNSNRCKVLLPKYLLTENFGNFLFESSGITCFILQKIKF